MISDNQSVTCPEAPNFWRQGRSEGSLAGGPRAGAQAKRVSSATVVTQKSEGDDRLFGGPVLFHRERGKPGIPTSAWRRGKASSPVKCPVGSANVVLDWLLLLLHEFSYSLLRTCLSFLAWFLSL